jgi:hypothetical protein
MSRWKWKGMSLRCDCDEINGVIAAMGDAMDEYKEKNGLTRFEAVTALSLLSLSVLELPSDAHSAAAVKAWMDSLDRLVNETMTARDGQNRTKGVIS